MNCLQPLNLVTPSTVSVGDVEMMEAGFHGLPFKVNLRINNTKQLCSNLRSTATLTWEASRAPLLFKSLAFFHLKMRSQSLYLLVDLSIGGPGGAFLEPQGLSVSTTSQEQPLPMGSAWARRCLMDAMTQNNSMDTSHQSQTAVTMGLKMASQG